MKRKIISVIVPTYNRRVLLEHTLHSIVHQTLDKSHYEVIIADDGSSDDTFDMSKTFEDKFHLKYAYHADNGFRPAAARNLGIRLAEGDYCLFLDSGIIAKRDCLEQHIRFHEKWTNKVAVLGYIYGFGGGTDEVTLKSLVDPNDADHSIAKLIRTGEDWVLDVRENIFRKYNDQIEKLSVPWAYFLGGHFSVAREALIEVDLFDENFDGAWGNEDIDLGYRLFKVGYDIALCRTACVLHLPHNKLQGNKSLEWKTEQGMRNAQYFHHKYQLPETKTFLELHQKDLKMHHDYHEYMDFHEAFISSWEKRNLA